MCVKETKWFTLIESRGCLLSNYVQSCVRIDQVLPFTTASSLGVKEHQVLHITDCIYSMCFKCIQQI